MKVKDITRSATKFSKNASAAGAEYETGVKNPKADWQSSTLAAGDNYDASVVAAISSKRFQTKVAATSSAKWAAKAATKGKRNYVPAVQEAGPDWAAGVQPYFGVLGSLNLTPRGPRGSPQNEERMTTVTRALHTARVGS